MKVTIDSSEPLDGALRLVGALYDVTLVVAEGAAPQSAGGEGGADSDGSADGRSGGRRAASASRPSRTGRQAKRTARKRAAGGGSSELREWARANGFQVSDRGRVPSAVQSAFDEAHAG